MKKLLLPMAIAAALPVTAMAAGPIDGKVYGKVNVSVVNDDNDSDDQWELNSNASRIGFKGKTQLSDNLYAIYKLEYETFIDDGEKDDNETFSQRNIYGGLTGGFGTVFAGKHDTPLKLAQKKIDLFNDLEGDIKHTFGGETRASNIVNYSSPKMSGFQVNIASIFGEDRSDDDKDGFMDSYSASVTYSGDGMYFAVARDENVKNGSFGKNLNKDFGIADADYVDITRAVAQLNMGDFQLGAMYQQTENGDSESDEFDADGYMISAKYKIDKVTLKAQWASNEEDDFDLEAESYSLGLDYKLGKKTKVYGFYTNEEFEAGSVTLEENDYFGVGMEHKF